MQSITKMYKCGEEEASIAEATVLCAFDIIAASTFGLAADILAAIITLTEAASSKITSENVKINSIPSKGDCINMYKNKREYTVNKVFVSEKDKEENKCSKRMYSLRF